MVDLENLNTSNPALVSLLEQGIFTTNKSGRRFSAMHLDQAHEQLNNVLKNNGGLAGLVSNPNGLKRFLLCGPIITRLLEEFDKSHGNR